MSQEEEQLKEEENILETLADFQNSINEQKIDSDHENIHDDVSTPKIDEINKNLEESDLQSIRNNVLTNESRNQTPTSLALSHDLELKSRPQTTKSEKFENEAYNELIKTLENGEKNEDSDQKSNSSDSQDENEGEEVICSPFFTKKSLQNLK